MIKIDIIYYIFPHLFINITLLIYKLYKPAIIIKWATIDNTKVITIIEL